MKNAILTIALFSLFLTVFTLTAYAEPTLLINESVVPTSYNSIPSIIFNATWTNTTFDENITACNLTLGRPNGSITNYSAMLNTTVPPVLCDINFTQESLGPAGNYNWTWHVKNDTEWVNGTTFSFTFGKAASNVTMFMNGSNTTKVVNLNQIINLTATSNITGLNVSLSLNASGYGNDFQNNTNLTSLGVGFYNFSA
ncbi:MAG: hypothetical protein V1678_02095, partial [Candidatus Aenigmatarchaeota archaeon]